MPSFSAYRLTWVSVTLDVGYLFTAVQQSAAAAPYLGGGVAPLAAAPDPGPGVALLGCRSCTVRATALSCPMSH